MYKSKDLDLYTFLYELKDRVQQDFNKIDFVLIGLHPKHNCDVKKIIKDTLGDVLYVAFNAVDLFENENIVNEGIVATFFEFDKDGVVDRFYMEDIRDYKLDDSLQKCADYLNSKKDNFHIILASYTKEKFGYFIEELSEFLDYTPIDNIIGGISSGIEIEDELITNLYTNGSKIEHGFIIITFKNIKAKIGISLGFEPYGVTYKISKASGSKIYLVDENKRFSKIVNNLLDGISNPEVRNLWYLPLNILDENDGFVSTLRTIKDVNDEFVELFGPIKENQEFKLSFATENKLINSDKKIAKIVSEDIKDIDILFNFSCIARQYVLGKKQKDELRSYIDTFNSPLFGFFTFGEIGPDREYKKLKLYNETSLIVGLKEL